MSYLLILFLNFVNTNGQLPIPLRDAAMKRGIFIGAEVDYSSLTNLSDPTFNKIVGEQYDLTTPGNACKWIYTEPEQNVYNFTQCDYVYSFSQSKNMTFRGHVIVWGNENPDWLTNGNFTPSELRSILQNHIMNLVNHYSSQYGNNRFCCWDVVAEAVSDNPSQQLFKPNIFYPSVPDYVSLAYQTAYITNPNVKLFYDEYNIIMDSGWMADKSNAVYNMIKNLTLNGIKVSGIAFQTHLTISDYSYIMNGYNSIVSNFKRFAKLGLEVHVSEMDIDCGAWVNGTMIPCETYTHEMEVQQAEMFQLVLRACLAVPQCTNFETWGFTDKYSWRGIEGHALPWDEYYNPKPAVFYIENELLNTTK